MAAGSGARHGASSPSINLMDYSRVPDQREPKGGGQRTVRCAPHGRAVRATRRAIRRDAITVGGRRQERERARPDAGGKDTIACERAEGREEGATHEVPEGAEARDTSFFASLQADGALAPGHGQGSDATSPLPLPALVRRH